MKKGGELGFAALVESTVTAQSSFLIWMLRKATGSL